MKTNEELSKAIDEAIDALFTEQTAPAAETVEKAKDVMSEIIGSPKESKEMKNGQDAGPAQTEADQVKAPKGKKEKDGENGRPKSISDVPDSDEDGSRAKGYESIQEKQAVPAGSGKGTIAKAFEVSEEDFELLQKAKKAKEAATLRKAQEDNSNLIKSAVVEATKGLKDENAALKKSIDETQALLKSIAKRPQPSKAVTNVAALEKGFGNGSEPTSQSKSFSKSEMLDVAESLVKSNGLTVEQVIELEDTGYIYDAGARSRLEHAIKNRK